MTPAVRHPVEQLWAAHHPADGYPAGVIPVPSPLPGLGFFPGGYGLWGAKADQPLPPFPINGVMVLGHDFHSEAGYRQSLRLGGERLTLPTWSNLLPMLASVGIDPEHCFFTNLYMGLRAGSAATGVFPGASDTRFVTHCKAFLLQQIAAQRPALILALGMHVPPVLAQLSAQLAVWSDAKHIKQLDAIGPVQHDVTFRGIENHQATVAALLHPSLRHASLRHRRYLGATGPAAELAILRKALALAGNYGELKLASSAA